MDPRVIELRYCDAVERYDIARRPIFVPTDSEQLVYEHLVDFEWFPGFSVSQKQKSIAALHAAGERAGFDPILEISSKSPNAVGTALSAFHLTVNSSNGPLPVELAFQSSKVYERGGPHEDMRAMRPIDAKRDQRHQTSGALKAFRYEGLDWPLETGTLFYDYLYLRALRASDWAGDVMRYQGFTDIEFSPEKSLNCQARSCALFVALVRRGELEAGLEDRRTLWHLTRQYTASVLASNTSHGRGNDQLQL